MWFGLGVAYSGVFVHILMVSCFLLLLRDEMLAFRAARSVRRNKNPCLSSLGAQGIGRARQKYVLDQITLYHFTPLRFSIKHADGLCPGPGEYFFPLDPSRYHANLNVLVFCIKALKQI